MSSEQYTNQNIYKRRVDIEQKNRRIVSKNSSFSQMKTTSFYVKT